MNISDHQKLAVLGGVSLFFCITLFTYWSSTLNYIDAFASAQELGCFSLRKGKILGTATTSGLVGYWSFDEGLGEIANDSSGQNNVGTLVNSPVWVDGKVGKALSFNGTDSYVKVPKVAWTSTGAITVSFWAKYKDNETRSPFNIGQTKNNAITALLPFSGNQTDWFYTLNNEASAVLPSMGEWFHITYMSGGDSASVHAIYINGKKVADTNNARVPNVPIASGLEIGRWIGWYDFYFKGEIDEFRIYNKILSEQEITGVYNFSSNESLPSTEKAKSSSIITPDLISPPPPPPPPPPTSPVNVSGNNFIRIKDLSGQDLSNRPVIISRVFKQGEIGAYPQAVVDTTAVLTQANVKSRWSDGSVKHALIAFAVNLPKSSWTKVSFANQSSCNCETGLTADAMLSSEYNFNAQMKLTPGGTVNARTMLQNGDFKYWLKGPIVTQVIIEDKTPALKYDLTFNGHKGFHPIVIATFFPSVKKVKMEFIGENAWVNTQQDITYSLSLLQGGTVLYTKANFEHSANMRFRKTFWSPSEFGKVQIDYNLPYLVDSKAIPNYDTSLVMSSETVSAWVNSRPASQCSQPSWVEAVAQGKVDIGGPSQVCPYMPAPGGRPDLGYLPGWYTAYLFGMGLDDSNSPTLYDMLIGNGEASASIRMHFRENLKDRLYLKDSGENAFGHFISIDARPSMVLKPEQGQSDAGEGDAMIRVGAINKKNGITPEVPHWPGLAYLPYVISGDYFFLEELWASASYVIGDTAEWDGYRVRNKNMAGIIAFTEFRGQAWALREVAQATFISPDESPEKAYYAKIFERNMAVREGMAGMTEGNFYNPNCSTTPFNRKQEGNPWCYGKNIASLYTTKNLYMQDNPLNLMEPGSDMDGGSYSAGFKPEKAKGSTAMWMWAYHWITLGHASEMGLPAKAYLNNRLKFLINILVHPDAVPELVAGYTIPTRNGEDKMLRSVKDFVEAYTPEAIQALKTSSYANGGDPQHGYANVIKAAASFLPGLVADGLSGDSAWNLINTALMKYRSGLALDQTWALVPRVETTATAQPTISVTVAPTVTKPTVTPPVQLPENTKVSPSGGGGGGGGVSNQASKADSSNSNQPKLINDKGTFYLIKDNKKFGVTNPGILQTHGYDFKDAQSATETEKQLLVSGTLTPAAGSLVKTKTDPTVFFVSEGKKFGFATSQVFSGLDYKFNSVVIVTEAELKALPEGGILKTIEQAHLDGSDVIDKAGTIYWISNESKLMAYPSLEVYNSWHKDNDFSQVVKANKLDLQLPKGEAVSKR